MVSIMQATLVDGSINQYTFYTDTVAELDDLPNLDGTAGTINGVSAVSAGSTAYCKADGSVYILTGSNEWATM